MKSVLQHAIIKLQNELFSKEIKVMKIKKGILYVAIALVLSAAFVFAGIDGGWWSTGIIDTRASYDSWAG